MKSSFDRDNNYCHNVIQRIAGFAITLYYHPAGVGTCIISKQERDLSSTSQQPTTGWDVIVLPAAYSQQHQWMNNNSMHAYY
jgi:hypothetical protein